MFLLLYSFINYNEYNGHLHHNDNELKEFNNFLFHLLIQILIII